MTDEILKDVRDMINTFCGAYNIDTSDELSDTEIDTICNRLKRSIVRLSIKLHVDDKLDVANELLMCTALCYRILLSCEQYTRMFDYVTSGHFICTLIKCIVRYESDTIHTEYKYITLLMTALSAQPGIFLHIFRYCLVNCKAYNLIFMFNRYVMTNTETENVMIKIMKDNNVKIDADLLKTTLEQINLDNYDMATSMCFILKCLFKYDDTLRDATIPEASILHMYTQPGFT